MKDGKITKTEGVLLGIAAVFLCGLLSLSAHDRAAAAKAPLETEREASQESFMPDLTPLDLNKADAEALEELPGIGPELARRIVEYRRVSGPFESVEGLLEVSGIGEGKLAGLQGLVSVDGERET